MRILFVDPPGAKVPRNPGVGINLAIATLAAVLVKQGHTVSLFDMANHYQNKSITGIKDALAQFKPDVICFSILNAQYLNALAAIKQLRSFTELPIIVGGAEVSAIKEKVFEDSDFAVDIAVLGEGEESLCKIVEILAQKEEAVLETVPGIIINKNRKLIKTGKPQLVKCLDDYPSPDLRIFGIKRLDLYRVLGSRGCPYNCSFCFSYLGRTWRGRNPDAIIRELIDAKRRYGFKRYRFLDPIFNFKSEWVHELCDKIMDSELRGIPWEALGVRADRLSDELCSYMAKAGCVRVAIGVESLHPKVFELIKKGETIDQVKDGVCNAVRHIDEVSLFMIIGLPGDTRKRSEFTYQEAKKLDATNISYALAVPYSGTRLVSWVQENAKILGTSYDSFTRNVDAVSGGVAYETEDFTKEERLETFKSLNTKECRYFSSSQYGRIFDPFLWFRDAIKYDQNHLPKHVFNIFGKSIKLYKRNIEGLLFGKRESFEIEYERIPDGTWWID